MKDQDSKGLLGTDKREGKRFEEDGVQAGERETKEMSECTGGRKGKRKSCEMTRNKDREGAGAVLVCVRDRNLDLDV